ncbi:MAG: hypothetical protein Q9162_001766 [Coniocarpon cinnabarinum]
MSWQLLERFIESEHFNRDPSLAVAYLSRYANHVGIQFILCSKLREFPYEEIEFFLPQLCHLLVSNDNESMALEEFILDLCQESAQSIVFGSFESIQPEKIHENVLPTAVLASIVLASVAAPFFPQALGPLAIAQARKPQPLEDTISEAPPIQHKVSRSHTVAGSSTKSRRGKTNRKRTDSGGVSPLSVNGSARHETSSTARQRPPLKPTRSSTLASPRSAPASRQASTSVARPSTSRVPTLTTTDLSDAGDFKSTASHNRPGIDESRRHSYNGPSGAPIGVSDAQKKHMLRSHYFRCETQFLGALESISNRLVALPKPARLSALRAELALITRDLPAEVDVPLVMPATLEDGVPSQSKHHRIVRLNPAEATSLNSAERVPYLLMLEVLRDDFDFNPDSPGNQRLLSQIMLDNESGTKRRLFDSSAAARESADMAQPPNPADSVFEPSTGDLSSPDLLKDLDLVEGPALDIKPNGSQLRMKNKTPPPRLSSAMSTVSSTSALSTLGQSDSPVSRTSSPGLRKQNQPRSTPQPGDQGDVSALANHIRTAAQMLAQLDTSSAKRPKHEVENIRAKIIASMQNLEDKNFSSDDQAPAPTFDSIIAASPTAFANGNSELPDNSDHSVENAANTAVGAARMENDEITGGVQRKGDRDDPSAATFGEEWNSKKARIRKTSPYGWMKNWDLLSVIVKTGSDLRQELFACQLIRLCAKIWEDAMIPVWVKQMRILVTGESSGLIETITNGVSIHSLKRSLTLASIAAGTNPKKRFASLVDHFSKSFGEVGSESYKAGQDAFKRSLAGYSVLSYILQLKDRHNGNLLIDNQGHVVHIDFGFMLSNSPGSVGFEAAPFKLTQDYVDVLGGTGSQAFEEYKSLCKQAFQALRKSAESIIMVVDLMSKESKMACFQSGSLATVGSLRSRFMLNLTKEEAESYVEDMIAKSLGSYYTRLYDTFQYRTQGIY